MPSNTKALHIVFVVAADLPEGGGNTSRLKTLVGTLNYLGHQVRILVEHSLGGVSQEVLAPSGEVNGVPFEYVLGHTQTPTGIKFLTEKWKSTQALMRRIKSLHRQKPVDIVWFNQLAAHDIAPITLMAKRLNIKTIQSYEDERMRGSGWKRKAIYANQYLADRYLSRWADALVVISHFLKEKYEQMSEGKTPIYIVPTIIDSEKWAAPPAPPVPPYRLLYAGSFFGFDEVEGVIEAVAVLVKEGWDLQFDMLGHNSNQPDYMAYIAQMIKDLGLERHITMHGFVPFSQLPSFLSKAHLLMGIRKDQGWSSTGFSTKLSEYLATGRPIICAAVGDNIRYLKDKESAFMLPAGADATAIADSIRHAFSNLGIAQQVGKNGQKIAKKYFDQVEVGKHLQKMLAEVVGK